MKIDTLTLHKTNNCGSSLQTYALQQFLIRLGYETEVIDYDPRYLHNNGDKLRALLQRILFRKDVKYGESLFQDFNERYLKLTAKTYRSYKELADNPPNADLFIAGSDQIWNPTYECGNDEAFFLSFVPANKRMSYAASVGADNLDDAAYDRIARSVEQFPYLSVREKTTSTILERRLGRHVQYSCDPTFLLDAPDYRDIAEYQCCPDEPYALVYLAPQCPELDDSVTLCKKCGLKVVQMFHYRKKCDCDLHIKNPGPRDFVGLIDRAGMIVTGSFHATVFSHILRKQFNVVLPTHNQSRILQLLEISHLNKRVVDGSRLNYSSFFEPIVFDLDDLSAFIAESKLSLESFLSSMQRN